MAPPFSIHLLFLFLLARETLTKESSQASSRWKRSSLSLRADSLLPNYHRNPHFDATALFRSRRNLFEWRGGDQTTGESNQPGKSKKSKKKKVKSDGSTTRASDEPAQDADSPKEEFLGNEREKIQEVLLDTDTADAMGEAIRNRADQLRRKATRAPYKELDQTLSSVGKALGAADRFDGLLNRNSLDSDEVDSVDASADSDTKPGASSILAYYFWKSHGGAHVIQCVCSLLATASGIGALWMTSGPSKLALLKRCMIFAMIKHVSGLLAAVSVTAKTIPDVGLRQSREWMHDLVTDPVSQYVFYASCTLLWLPQQYTTDTTKASSLWWMSYPVISAVLLGPVLIREFISTMLVVSDVFVLWTSTVDQVFLKTVAKQILSFARGITNAWMSLLVTPAVWRSADALERQAILARLTSRVSLALEVLVGGLLVLDGVKLAMALIFATREFRPPILSVIKTMICTRLYLLFLWTRRRNISKLAHTIRGGASNVPFYVLNLLMDPAAAMGIDYSVEESGRMGRYVLTILGLDDDKKV